MGRHSRKAPAPAPARQTAAPAPSPYGPGPDGLYEPDPYPADPYEPQPSGLRAHEQGPSDGYGEPRGHRRSAEPPVVHQGYAPPPARPGGHPEQYEEGGAWGADPAAASVYGDWRGTPRAAAPPAPRRDTAAPDFGTPAAGFPRVAEQPPAPAPDPFTSTGSHRRVPGPRKPDADRVPKGRGTRIRTYTGIAALAVTAVLAVVVAGQVTGEGDPAAPGARAAGDDPQRALGDKAASRSDGRPTPASPPPAQPLTYEQQMAQQLPIDAKLTGPGTFDTVPGTAKAPGKGKVVRYRVDVEQGLGMDPQLFAEAVQRTLNDPRSWAHDGAMTFERVPGGETDFVITLASPGTTGAWCAKSSLDTTIDNVSCDSASTDRVMINAFRWGQGSVTYGADQMLAYRQMLINHEVGHRLGHGHVSCQKPGSPAPIMQQQTKSLDIDNIHCLPNPWVFPGNS
ncbi:DUF3152 domain-containing protein [Streptomyces sp. NPDC029216]|uniref:DUF3152 domain-containing protein n=1 Tax=Streptomyces sp. NPDC029216 TaxID=3154701 RepID=UPI0033F7561A